MTAFLLAAVFTLAATVAAFAIGRRDERKAWKAKLVDGVNDDAGQQWAAGLLELVLRSRGPNDPLVICDKAGKKVYTLHHKPDLDVFVYHPVEGPIVHGKTFSKWARRVYGEIVRHATAP